MQLVHSLKAMDKFCPFTYEEISTNEQRLNIVREALPKVIENRLTERQKECVRLYYFENKNMEQTATALGIERSSVSRTLKRARQRIKTSLEYLI